MPEPTNADVAAALDRYGSLLELSGGNPFRARAFHEAASGIRALGESVTLLCRADRLTEIAGVGPGIATAVREIVTSGRYRPLVELERTTPAGLIEVVALPGIGIKSARRLHEELGITDLAGLESAAVAGRLRGLRGFGAKSEAVVLAGIEALRRRTGRILLGTALPRARLLAAEISDRLPDSSVSLAGSLRRMEETVGDLDVVIGVADPARARAAIADLPSVAAVRSEFADGLRLVLQGGLEADVFIATPAAFGVTLLRATGSAAHLAMLGELPTMATTESKVYARRGLPWIPPELRQGRDEFERLGEIDRLVTTSDVHGEFHCHTTWSDGSATIEEMASTAASRGYRYLAITDHSRGLGVANGLDVARLAAQRRELGRFNSDEGIRLLTGSEVEVSRDGSLDFSDDVLSKLDLVVASLHVGLRQPQAELTERLVGVLRNRHVDLIAHPSGRLIERREGGDFDWDQVFTVAAETGTALEINADPARLDLNDQLARRALAAGCLLTINCDAHHPAGFDQLEYGIAVARRAWVRPDQILNCRPLAEVETWLRQRGRRARAGEPN